MLLQEQPAPRRIILFGTPALTLILLLFHPVPDPAAVGNPEVLRGLDLVNLLAPVAELFLAVHVIFALLLALLGLSIMILTREVRGIVATVSKVCAFIFSVAYIIYETLIGTATGLLVSGAAGLPPFGPFSMLLFLIAAVWFERAAPQVLPAEPVAIET